MVRPALVKLGGSVLTDKDRERSFRRSVARRLLGEVAKSGVPAILLHGAGGYGHPAAARHQIGERPVTSATQRAGVSEVLAAAGLLHAEVVDLAAAAGLRPVSVPLHLAARSEGDALLGVPVAETRRLLEDGYAPVLAGTLVRDERLGWRVASADEILATLADELDPRFALFVTDVDGVYDRDPGEPGARLLARTGTAAGGAARGTDVTGGMAGKLACAREVAAACPTLIVNGNVRGRVLQALQGKDVVGTWVDAA